MSISVPPPDHIPITCSTTDGFVAWLQQSGGSIFISTYQCNKVAVLSWDGRQISLLMRDFQKPLGMALHGPHLALATKHDITLFADAPQLAPDYLENVPNRYDALFLPRVSYHTGDLHAHDVAFGKEGLWLVNTRYCCLAGLSHDYCFIPRWKPPFLSELAPEDRCHLNGLAMVDGTPRYVTALGETDTAGGWRERKADGGILMNVPEGEILLRGLSMPHSPRWHQGAVFFLNSGTGELCRYSPGASSWDVVCRLPAFLRGLCCVGNCALVGLSTIREKHLFGGLPVQQAFDKLVCGVAIVDLTSGREIGRFEFTAGCTELYESLFVPRLQRPMITNLQQEATRQAFPSRDFSYWLRPSNVIPDSSG